ncbi:MAG TPA: N-acetyl sugar amidotransferase [bacterium]|nr:N-acetyl sugar amidotransferase [bacterium]HPN42141.1 N-acetyl sugar amidotransferase [bacterium]
MKSMQICTRCVSDTTMQDIVFDENGMCNFCKLHDKFIDMHPLGEKGESIINNLVEKIKRAGKNKKYDCIIGLSGGSDSTYLLYWACKQGLRPLAVTFDNGWNTEISVKNIKNATDKLGVDLHTVVADWEEMKDLQRSFLEASVSDADAPSDYAIYSVLYTEAIKAGVRYSLNGHSFRAEGTVPKSWSYFDGRYVKSVLKLYGTRKKIKSFPIMSLLQFVYYVLVKRIKDVRVFDYIEYNKAKAKEIITRELDWKDYSGHHHENVFTRFFQSYFLPVKFNIDKRKVEYSALIRSNQLDRNKALQELASAYPYDVNDVEYVIKKLGYTEQEFERILHLPKRTFHDYPTYHSMMKKLKFPIKIAAQLNLIPKILYEKYAEM